MHGAITPALIAEFTAKGYWGARSYVSHLLAHARQRPDAIAVVDAHRRLRFAELAAAADRLAARFAALGLGPGDVVGVQLPNVAEFHAVRYALAAIGAVTLPIGVVYRERELLHALGLTGAKALVVPESFKGIEHAAVAVDLRTRLPALAHVLVANCGTAPVGAQPLDAWREERSSDPATYPHLDAARSDPNAVDLLLMSSGTTGLPKVVMTTPNAWLYTGEKVMQLIGTRPDDVVLSLPPITGGAGYNNGLGSPCISGAAVVLQDTFDAAGALEWIRRERVTSVAAVPAQAIKMLEVLERSAEPVLPSAAVRVWLSVGAYLPPTIARRLERRLGCRVVNVYGAVEAAVIAANGLDDPAESRHTSIGRIVDGTQVKIVDASGTDVPPGEVGDVLTRQPAMAAGYFADPEATRRVFGDDGWVRTGDSALLDADGVLRIQGRTKDVISRGALKISAEEVEDLLRTHASIVDAALVGMPDPVLGERSCAYVVVRDGAAPSLGDVVAFLQAEQLATFKLPERLEIVADLPYSAGLKVQKNVLREDIANKLAAEAAAPGSARDPDSPTNDRRQT